MNDLEEIEHDNVLALVSSNVRASVIKAFQDHPEFHTMHEHDLERIIGPSVNATLIRAAFWDEYKRAKDNGQKMVMTKIYDGVMSREGFYSFLENPKNVAWMMCPPADEFLQMKADTYKTRQEYSKILRMPLVINGQIDIKAFNASIKIYQMYSDRIHGSVVQRIEKKTQHIPANGISGTSEEIRKKIQELEAIQVSTIDTPIDVEDIISAEKVINVKTDNES